MTEAGALPDRPFRLAAWYDLHTREVLPYPDVAAVFGRLLRQFDPPVERVFEVGCGTGNLTTPLARLGFRVTGLDVAPDMLAVARRRSAAAGLDIPYVLGDLRDARPEPPVDAVVCFYGGLNYLTSTDALRQGLAAIRGALRPGGLFAFDQFTEHRMRRLFSGHHRTRVDGATVVTRSRCLPDGRIAHRLTIERAGRRQVERHRLRIHPNPELTHLLGETGFVLLHRSELSAELGGCLDLADDFVFVVRRS